MIAGTVAPAGGLAPPQVTAFVLADVAVILIAARVCGAGARRSGQPAVVGEIVAGVLLGPTLLGPTLAPLADPPVWLACEAALSGTDVAPSVTACLFPPQSQAVLAVLGQLALLLFSFLVGLDLNFDHLRGSRLGVALVAVGAVAVPVGAAFALQPVLYSEPFTGAGDPSALSFNLFVGALLAVTALPVMARVLQEKALTATRVGALAVTAAAVVTVLTFVVAAIADAVAGGADAGDLTLRLALIGAFIAGMLGVVRPLLAPVGRRAQRRAQHGAQRWVAHAAGREILTPPLFALVVVVALLAGWASHALGISVVVGGFLAGVAMPAREPLRRDVAGELFHLTAIVLFPVFLAVSGLNTDFTTLTAGSLGGLGLLLVAGVVAKWPIGAGLARGGGLSWAEGNALGVLLNCRGPLPLVVALMGLHAGVISPVLQVGAVLMALLTTAMTGPLLDRLSATGRADGAGGSAARRDTPAG